MKKRFLNAAAIIFLPAVMINAQESKAKLDLTLAGAQDYALQHNKSINSANLDIKASKMAVWEAISAGLPNIASSGSFTDNLKQMVFLIPDFMGGDPTKKTPITMGSEYSASVALQASMPLFNASYYVGIQTSKLARKLSEMNAASTEIDVKETVASIYHLILVSEESMKVLDGILGNMRETLKATKAMFNVGMAESTDVDQMVSNVSVMENSRSSLERNIEMNYNLLRFQLGVGMDTEIHLTETLDDIVGKVNVESLLSQDFNLKQNITYQLVEGQESMMAQNLKMQKAAVLPSLAGVVSTTKTGMGDKLSEVNWYNSSLVGLQLSVPIVASGQRYAKIKKARLNLENAANTKAMVTDQLKLQEKQLRYNLVNANSQYKSQKENVDVSKRVYSSTENKYKQGMASSLDLTQANSLLLNAENSYISALMNLLQTKLDLDKLLNNM